MENTNDNPGKLIDHGLVQIVKIIRLANVKSSDRLTREAIRARTYELFCKGYGVARTSREICVNRVTVSRWFQQFRAGECSLFNGERRRGRKALLNEIQKADLRHAVSAGSPLDYHLPFRRWSFAAVAELVKAKFGIKISRATAGKWLMSDRDMKLTDGAEAEDKTVQSFRL